MLRSLPRAAPSSAPLRVQSHRIDTNIRHLPAAACLLESRQHQKRHAGIHAISNPTLAGIEKRWEGMPPQQQADLWMALRDRMKVNWHEMTLQEKKAAYWIAFGPHGPRSLPPPGEGKKIFWYTMLGVGVSGVIFLLIRTQSRPAPKTMTAQYQAMTNEYLKAQRTEPITGVSSEGYTGKGMIQSKPRKGPPPDEDED
ncbi:Cytochrome c oxidase subunit 5B, mitochondrial [Xanthoria parietina]